MVRRCLMSFAALSPLERLMISKVPGTWINGRWLENFSSTEWNVDYSADDHLSAEDLGL